eukprot:TRINITY_DN4270_c0_g1_i1.p1 TRINITY_DN4270_c0_g1~~TRINITY_DN4270_c0_g1_i1.p1  ORF type:complete len:204 (+),score=36.63 TRINITY_DN4270_c0_g1_i1:167-778(+)
MSAYKLPVELSKTIDSLENELVHIEKYLKPFLESPLKDVTASLTPLEEAKLNVISAFAINTLFYMYLKTQGVSPSKHRVKEELERVKLYFQKIKAISTKSQPSSQVDLEAAKRFIAQGIGKRGKENTPQVSESVSESKKSTVDSKKRENEADKKAGSRDKKRPNEVKGRSEQNGDDGKNKTPTPEKRKAESLEVKNNKKRKSL